MGCSGEAFTDGFAEYQFDPENVQAAKDAYNAKMVECQGPADRTVSSTPPSVVTVLTRGPV